jgi:hypothetical protein
MPKEIKITPGTPDSVVSAVSSATGLVERPNSNGRSMLKSVLPEMASETEECSIDQSIFTWTTNPFKQNAMGNAHRGDAIENRDRVTPSMVQHVERNGMFDNRSDSKIESPMKEGKSKTSEYFTIYPSATSHECMIHD